MNTTILLQRIENEVRELKSDDNYALELAKAKLMDCLLALEEIPHDERPCCEHCLDRMSPEDNVGNDLCIKCDRENRDCLEAREEGYLAYVGRAY